MEFNGKEEVNPGSTWGAWVKGMGNDLLLAAILLLSPAFNPP
jgi:hypothetical protein